jgi:hypothetical protein
MKAHQRIEGTSYGPEALNAMTQAFDQAWSVIGGNIGRDTSEAARLRLANALLSVATDDSRDAKALKRKALEAMALSYYAVPSDISRSDTLPIAGMLDSSSPEKNRLVQTHRPTPAHPARAADRSRIRKAPVAGVTGAMSHGSLGNRRRRLWATSPRITRGC